LALGYPARELWGLIDLVPVDCWESELRLFQRCREIAQRGGPPIRLHPQEDARLRPYRAWVALSRLTGEMGPIGVYYALADFVQAGLVGVREQETCPAVGDDPGAPTHLCLACGELLAHIVEGDWLLCPRCDGINTLSPLHQEVQVNLHWTELVCLTHAAERHFQEHPLAPEAPVARMVARTLERLRALRPPHTSPLTAAEEREERERAGPVRLLTSDCVLQSRAEQALARGEASRSDEAEP
jgi:hypothetical protein